MFSPLLQQFEQLVDDNSDGDDQAPAPASVVVQPEAASRTPMRAKLREIIVSHYRSRGRLVESEAVLPTPSSDAPSVAPPAVVAPSASMKSNIKRIIRAEQIREMVEQMATIDLNRACDLVRMSTKECLHKLIDDQDGPEAS